MTLRAVGGHRHRTTQKIRCVAQCHQLLRTDFEERAADSCCDELRQAYVEMLPEDGIVVLSDYAKGALRDSAELIELARARGCTVLVDPKGRDFTRYRNAHLIKPNASELAAVVGAWLDDAELKRKCSALRRRLGVASVLVTRGESGLSLFDQRGARHHRADVREVFDVCGAGDTVIATLARVMATGRSLDEAARWANKAAGIAVSRFGTTAVTLSELGFDPGLDAANLSTLRSIHHAGMRTPSVSVEALQ